MSRGRSLKHALPARTKSPRIETTQMHDLVLNRLFGRGTTIATFLLHRIRLAASLDLKHWMLLCAGALSLARRRWSLRPCTNRAEHEVFRDYRRKQQWKRHG